MFEGKTILLVDDDYTNIFALSAVLKSKGPVIYTAKDGAECLKILKSTVGIDIVLLDMMMPEMDGFQAIQEIRKDVGLKHIPVISVTSLAMKEDRKKCMLAGADDYLSKPLNIDSLLEKIKALLN